jgi:hypothetical protein
MATLIERFISLREKKDHLISKNPNLTDDEKVTLNCFFKEHPSAENEGIGGGKVGIDWNRKDLTFSDFEPLMNKYVNKRIEKENKEKEKKNFWRFHITPDLETPFIERAKEGEIEYKTILKSKDFIMVEPLNWHCAQFMDNTELYGVGAKWCIGHEKDNSYWIDYYENDGVRFLFIFLSKNKQKIMVKINMDIKLFLIQDYLDYDENTYFLTDDIFKKFVQVLNITPVSLKTHLEKENILDSNKAIINPFVLDNLIPGWKNYYKKGEKGREETIEKYPYSERGKSMYTVWNAEDEIMFNTNNLNKIFDILDINLSPHDYIKATEKSPVFSRWDGHHG